MNFTKEHLLKLVETNQTDFFQALCMNDDITEALEILSNIIPELSEEEDYVIDNIDYRCVYHLNMGDGNDLIDVYEFKFENDPETVLVKCDGWYSSWDSSGYESCYLAEPFEYTETRYRRKQSK